MGVLLNRKNKRFVRNSIFYFLTFVAAYVLKRHYSTASADDLVWILGPTAAVVEWMTGIEFFMECGTGYVNQSIMVVIAKSCAGVNFLIISICMSVFEILPKLRTITSTIISIAGIFMSMFIITVFVNAVRITAAIYLLRENIHFGWLTPERLHRIEGIVVYFLCLWLIFVFLQKAVEHMKRMRQEENMGYA